MQVASRLKHENSWFNFIYKHNWITSSVQKPIVYCHFWTNPMQHYTTENRYVQTEGNRERKYAQRCLGTWSGVPRDGWDSFLCLFLSSQVCVLFRFFVSDCRYQCNWLPEETRLWNDRLRVEWDVKPYTLISLLSCQYWSGVSVSAWWCCKNSLSWHLVVKCRRGW